MTRDSAAPENVTAVWVDARSQARMMTACPAAQNSEPQHRFWTSHRRTSGPRAARFFSVSERLPPVSCRPSPPRRKAPSPFYAPASTRISSTHRSRRWAGAGDAAEAEVVVGDGAEAAAAEDAAAPEAAGAAVRAIVAGVGAAASIIVHPCSAAILGIVPAIGIGAAFNIGGRRALP
jgi:hypothetical protein